MSEKICQKVEDGRKGLPVDYWLRYYVRMVGVLASLIPPYSYEEALSRIDYHIEQIKSIQNEE